MYFEFVLKTKYSIKMIGLKKLNKIKLNKMKPNNKILAKLDLHFATLHISRAAQSELCVVSQMICQALLDNSKKGDNKTIERNNNFSMPNRPVRQRTEKGGENWASVTNG